MRTVALAWVTILTFAGLALVRGDEDEKKKIKEPDKVKSLHDAMEGVGAQAKKIGYAFRDKKHGSIEADARKMLKYISKATEQKPPELVESEEDEKQFKEWQKALQESIQRVKEAVGESDFKAAKQSWKKAGTFCGKCHNRFRQEEEEEEEE